MSASRRPVTGSGKRALVALAMGAITSPLLIGLTAGSASAAVDITTACPEDAFDDAGFTDIAGQNAQFQLAINCLAALGITTGQTETTFNPTGSITRAQFSQFLFRLGNLLEVDWDTADSGFEDLGGVSAEARNAINALRNAGVVNGRTETTFEPLAQVRRDQMASFLNQFYENVIGESLPGTVVDAFTDDEGNVHEDNINAIAAADIADGVATNLYAPGQPVERAQMAAFVARTVQVLINEELIPPLFEEPAPEPTVAIDNEGSVTAGAEFTGTFADLPEGATITVSGAGLTDEAVTVGDDGTFTLRLPANAPTGAQTLTFTITVDGETFTVTADINVMAQPSTTARPDLLSATVVGTVAPNQATPTSPAGTTVRYTFDENVTVSDTDGANGVQSDRFRAYRQGGELLTGTFLSATDSTVDVLYPTVTAATGAGGAEELTLATAEFNAVTDASGLANPEFDAALGTTSGGGSVPLPAGITDAPDLVSVGGFRQAATAGQTAVDFTFDEAANVTGEARFRLVLTNGSVIDAVALPAVGITGTGSDPSGGTVAGGNGTTTITALFTSPTSTTTPVPPLAASAVARAVVEAGAVSDAAQTTAAGIESGNANVLQAAAGAGQQTPGPDLVSVTLQPGSTPGTGDRALFTFDENVDVVANSLLSLYNTDGDVVAVSNAAINPSNRAQVLVDVADGVARVVGGSAAAGAVTVNAVAATPTTPARDAEVSEPDEQGVANTMVTEGRVAGRTARPDLIGVAINQAPADRFGNPGAYQATYTFDVDVAAAGAAVPATPGSFFLYLGDGSKLRGTAVSTANTTEENDNSVTVTGFEVLLVTGAVRGDDPATPNVDESVASQAEIRAAVLGTVPAGAVTADGAAASPTNTNPIGAERTTGGNGTLQ